MFINIIKKISSKEIFIGGCRDEKCSQKSFYIKFKNLFMKRKANINKIKPLKRNPIKF